MNEKIVVVVKVGPNHNHNHSSDNCIGTSRFYELVNLSVTCNRVFCLCGILHLNICHNFAVLQIWAFVVEWRFSFVAQSECRCGCSTTSSPHSSPSFTL